MISVAKGGVIYTDKLEIVENLNKLDVLRALRQRRGKISLVNQCDHAIDLLIDVSNDFEDKHFIQISGEFWKLQSYRLDAADVRDYR